MTRPCDSAHSDPVPRAVMVGTLFTSGYNTGPLVYPDTAYCQECIDIIGDDFADRTPLASAPSQTSTGVDDVPADRRVDPAAQQGTDTGGPQ